MSADFHTDEDIDAIALLIAQGALPVAGMAHLWEDKDGEALPRYGKLKISRLFDNSLARFCQHYFSENFTFDENDFERRFYMPRVVFD